MLQLVKCTQVGLNSQQGPQPKSAPSSGWDVQGSSSHHYVQAPLGSCRVPSLGTSLSSLGLSSSVSKVVPSWTTSHVGLLSYWEESWVRDWLGRLIICRHRASSSGVLDVICVFQNWGLNLSGGKGIMGFLGHKLLAFIRSLLCAKLCTWPFPHSWMLYEGILLNIITDPFF